MKRTPRSSSPLFTSPRRAWRSMPALESTQVISASGKRARQAHRKRPWPSPRVSTRCGVGISAKKAVRQSCILSPAARRSISRYTGASVSKLMGKLSPPAASASVLDSTTAPQTSRHRHRRQRQTDRPSHDPKNAARPIQRTTTRRANAPRFPLRMGACRACANPDVDKATAPVAKRRE